VHFEIALGEYRHAEARPSRAAADEGGPAALGGDAFRGDSGAGARSLGSCAVKATARAWDRSNQSLPYRWYTHSYSIAET
jgi:hypothetical protein